MWTNKLAPTICWKAVHGEVNSVSRRLIVGALHQIRRTNGRKSRVNLRANIGASALRSGAFFLLTLLRSASPCNNRAYCKKIKYLRKASLTLSESLLSRPWLFTYYFQRSNQSLNEILFVVFPLISSFNKTSHLCHVQVSNRKNRKLCLFLLTVLF